MQGPRNPEAKGNVNRSVLGKCTPQRRRIRETQQMGVFQQPAKKTEAVQLLFHILVPEREGVNHNRSSGLEAETLRIDNKVIVYRIF